MACESNRLSVAQRVEIVKTFYQTGNKAETCRRIETILDKKEGEIVLNYSLSH